MIVQMTLSWNDETRLYDLSDGSLVTNDCIGHIRDLDVWSAEKFLEDIDDYGVGQIAHVIVTHYEPDDIVYHSTPDTLTGRGCE